jgi:Glycosyltransferase 61
MEWFRKDNAALPAGDPSASPGRLPPMQRFENVTVGPTTAMMRGGVLRGGPVWPDFENRVAARHCRDGRPVDKRPIVTVSGWLRGRLEGPTVWGGIARAHFGHLVSEFTTRVMQSLNERPADRFLFQLDVGAGVGDVPCYFWSVVDWYGVPREQVAFVARPVRVRELRVAAQAEQMRTVGPPPDYLDLLDANFRRRGLTPEPSRILYVGRPGLAAKGLGGHAGEGYLVSLLGQLGVRVLDPAVADLRTQLAAYAGAETIVFAEGSAMHGRQLLGRVDQAIVVLERRGGWRLAEAHLTPRCREIRYVDVARTFMAPVRQQGPNKVVGVAFYDEAVLKRTFAELGIDLASVWDRSAYRAACVVDATGWMDVRLASPNSSLPGRTFNAVRKALDAEGLRELTIPIPASSLAADDVPLQRGPS